MNTRIAQDERTDFEAWARLLITRKVPDHFQNLINPRVVHRGAEILERGDAFEVHVYDRTLLGRAADNPQLTVSTGERILLNPL